MTQVSVRVRRAAGVLIALVAAALTVLGTAGAASAHGSLVSTDPADGSVVPSPPSAVTLTFDDAVGLPPDALRVFGPEGERADAGAPDHAGDRTETLRVALREDLRDGTYTVAWQAISADSHPVGGAFTFSVGAPSETSVSAEELQGPRTDGLIGFLYGTVSGIAYAGFALLAGAASFVVLCWPAGASVRRVQKLLVAGWVALLGSTAVQMMLRGPYEAGSGVVPGETAPETAAHVAVDQITYVALAVRLLLLVVSGVLLVLLVGAQARPSGGEGTRSTRLPVWLRAAGLASAAGMAATWVVADHASEGPQVWLAMPVTVLHVLAMAAWLGGLVTLLAGLGHGLPPVAAARFSRLAFGSVLVLVLTGLYRSWRDVGSWEALFGTRYGQLLLLKVAGVALMLAAAWFSRSRISRLRTGGGAGLRTGSPAPAPALAAVSGARRHDGPGEGPEHGAGNDRPDGPEASRPDGFVDGLENGGADGGANDRPDRLETGRADGPGNGRADGPEGGAANDRPDGFQAGRMDGSPHRRADGRGNGAGGDLGKGAGAAEALRARAALRRSVLTEAALAVVVLTVTTMLVATPPGRAADTGAVPAGAPAADGAERIAPVRIAYDTGGDTPGARGTATLTLDPAKGGGHTVRLLLRDADGRPADVPEVRLAFTLPARDLGPLRVPLRPQAPGGWSGPVRLTLAGDWTVSLTVRSSGIDQATSTGRLTLGG